MEPVFVVPPTRPSYTTNHGVPLNDCMSTEGKENTPPSSTENQERRPSVPNSSSGDKSTQRVLLDKLSSTNRQVPSTTPPQITPSSKNAAANTKTRKGNTSAHSPTSTFIKLWSGMTKNIGKSSGNLRVELQSKDTTTAHTTQPPPASPTEIAPAPTPHQETAPVPVNGKKNNEEPTAIPDHSLPVSPPETTTTQTLPTSPGDNIVPSDLSIPIPQPFIPPHQLQSVAHPQRSPYDVSYDRFFAPYADTTSPSTFTYGQHYYHQAPFNPYAHPFPFQAAVPPPFIATPTTGFPFTSAPAHDGQAPVSPNDDVITQVQLEEAVAGAHAAQILSSLATAPCDRASFEQIPLTVNENANTKTHAEKNVAVKAENYQPPLPPNRASSLEALVYAANLARADTLTNMDTNENGADSDSSESKNENETDSDTCTDGEGGDTTEEEDITHKHPAFMMSSSERTSFSSSFRAKSSTPGPTPPSNTSRRPLRLLSVNNNVVIKQEFGPAKPITAPTTTQRTNALHSSKRAEKVKIEPTSFSETEKESATQLDSDSEYEPALRKRRRTAAVKKSKSKSKKLVLRLKTHVPKVEGRKEDPLWVYKPFRCEFDGCGAAFRQLGQLTTHIRDHTGEKTEKPVRCTVRGCTVRFSNHANLKSHMRTHTGERPFKCKHKGCNADFQRNYSLKIHMRMHTGERPYTCVYAGCDASFSTSVSLTKHVLVHTGEKPFACVECGREFADKSNMKKHEKSQHGAE